MDIVSKTSIWELKCTSKITQEHQLQVLIYAWLWETLYPNCPRTVRLFNLRTGEKQRLEIKYEVLTKIVLMLLQNKYEEPDILEDEQFLDICDSIKKKIYKYSIDFLIKYIYNFVQHDVYYCSTPLKLHRNQ